MPENTAVLSAHRLVFLLQNVLLCKSLNIQHWCLQLFTSISRQPRRHGGALVGLAPKQISKPPQIEFETL